MHILKHKNGNQRIKPTQENVIATQGKLPKMHKKSYTFDDNIHAKLLELQIKNRKINS